MEKGIKKGWDFTYWRPRFYCILQVYKDNKNDINSIWQPLMGGQEYDKNFHFAVFNKNFLINILTKCGYRKGTDMGCHNGEKP